MYVCGGEDVRVYICMCVKFFCIKSNVLNQIKNIIINYTLRVHINKK